jgi:hypothetical protein
MSNQFLNVIKEQTSRALINLENIVKCVSSEGHEVKAACLRYGSCGAGAHGGQL